MTPKWTTPCLCVWYVFVCVHAHAHIYVFFQFLRRKKVEYVDSLSKAWWLLGHAACLNTTKTLHLLPECMNVVYTMLNADKKQHVFPNTINQLVFKMETVCFLCCRNWIVNYNLYEFSAFLCLNTCWLRHYLENLRSCNYWLIYRPNLSSPNCHVCRLRWMNN
jgi:hypothetical protein